jgi:histidine kinase
MITLSGYKDFSLVHSGERNTIYRADKNGKPVIIKVLQKEYPTAKELEEFKYEYDILRSLKSNHIIDPICIEKFRNSLAIVFEDIGGIALSKILQERGILPLEITIDIFLKTLFGLAEVHNKNLVHRDIKIQNIVFNQETGALQIIDFGIASRLTKQNSFVNLKSSLEGTLTYISPEQTGRMNRGVDYRTDFYSLGVTFYQLVTGMVPFLYSDPLELIHAHIAKIPIPPFEKNKTPKAISNIIMKLMEKNPEARYQSVSGIIRDLEICKRSIANGGLELLQGLDLVVGKEDFSGRFQIPEKLYGREKEISQILELFKGVTEDRTELILISGRSGIGKTALVNEINKPVSESHGYFASGKYDLLKRTIPYRAITQSFQSLVQQILTESEASINVWKKTLLDSLGGNAKLIIDVIPDLGTLLGEQPLLPILSPEESQNRFNIVFQNFIKAFSTKDHPIAIFLDDLQWADTPSIQLIERIISNTEIKNFCLILSFRDNEVYPGDSFSLMLESLNKNNFHYHEIKLNPVSITDIGNLVNDTLACGKNNSLEIAQVLYDKTKGNPFFINAVFKDFYDKDLIQFSGDSWNYNIIKIREEKITENVIDFMILKVRDISTENLEILKFAACVGNWFKIDVFVQIFGGEDIKVKESLIQLANEGFLRQNETEVYFVHDKIREAAYSVVSNEERSRNHYKIGRGYLTLLDRYKLEDYIFTIVNQLNQGRDLINTDEEKKQLLQFNIMAGKRALSSNAYEAAVGFLNIAIQTLPANSWTTNYELVLDLYSNLAQAEYLKKDYEQAENSFTIILTNGKTARDKIIVYELKSSLYVSQNRMVDALDLLKKALKLLGINLPRKPTELSPLPELIKFKFLLGKKTIKELEAARSLVDMDSHLILHLLNSAIPPSFIAEPALFPVLVLKMVNLSIRKGNSALGAFAYALFGVIQGSGLGDYTTGYKFANLALRLLTLYPEEAKVVECRTRFVCANMVNHWKDHAKDSEPEFHKSIASGRETGDLQYTSYAINNMHFQMLLMRQNLSQVLNSFLKYDELFESLKQYNAYQLFQLNKQFIENLTGEVDSILLLKGKYFNEEDVLSEWINSNNANALFDFYLSKSRLEFLFGEKEKAYEYSLLADPFETAMLGMMFVPEHVFFNSLIISSLFHNADFGQQKLYKKRLIKNVKRLEKWSSNCEANYGHKYHICLGLLGLIEGKDEYAMREFKLAIQLAKKHDYLFEEAIANEFVALIWNRSKDDPYSRLHLVEAHYAYGKWGCRNKLIQLEKTYPFLRTRKNEIEESFINSETNLTYVSSSSSRARNFDLISVLKASQAISSEIQLGKLLERMMKILIENAGAESGYFILKRSAGWQIEAEGNSNRDEILTLQAKPIEEFKSISANIVNYVIRTKSLVLLNDATNSGMFVNDSYVTRNASKSLLCYPILNQGSLIGLIYLENNLLTNAFTPERVEVLKVLSAQIAMSLENSLLYASLEEKVKERTKNLNEALIDVSALKEQQDMDYFLNTLLVEPLGVNKANSDNVTVDFFLKQKKNFLFRNKEYELGGDINISDNMVLLGKRYTVFLNGDGMGKSVQGAGGVLVIGTIFRSIIQRTISTDYGTRVYPERWIKNAYLEMQKAFESFDGSMLMSATFGLLDEELGTLYFMNVSHPDLVLYREGKAEYIVGSNHLPKLGHDDPLANISLNVMALKAGDIVLLGSDGRDDLIIGKDIDGTDIFNNDDSIFLKNVEHANANLQQIYELILETGKIIDDLSLLRIAWHGSDNVTANEINHEKVLLEIANLKNKQAFEDILKLAKEMIAQYPHYSAYLYEISYAHGQLGQYNQAIDFGEKLRLREPDHLSIIVNLIDSYHQIGKIDRAKAILSFSLKTLKDDGRLMKMKAEFAQMNGADKK